MIRLFCVLLYSSICLNLLQAQQPIIASQSYLGEYARGDYEVYRDGSPGLPLREVKKPFILVEGFDPNQEYGIYPSVPPSGKKDIYKEFRYSPSFLGYELTKRDYDVIILNFENGGDYIQRNSMLLIELIEKLNMEKNSEDQLVVAGYSMGGLVARYALTYMEKHEKDHNTRLYISMDSPHKGAHVPVGLQALVRTFDSQAMQTMFPQLAESINQLDAPAAKQMLKYRLKYATQANGEIDISQDFLKFFNELSNLNECNGFPTKCRNIAFSLGSWNGVGQRSNQDIDQDGMFDFQYHGTYTMSINIPFGSGSSTQLIWELDQCEAAGAFSFQTFMSNAYAQNYPHLSSRSSYTGLGANDNTSTYYYLNPGTATSLFFPSGAWDRFWFYKENEPIDFAPGGNIDIYRKVGDALNEQIDCSEVYANSHTFIPTVSALAFDTDDLFYNIEGDPNKLEKTPFDAIIGISGDNLSHVIGDNNTSQVQLVSNFVLNEVDNDNGFGCAYNNIVFSESINAGTIETIENANTVSITNASVASGGVLNVTAAEEILVLPTFDADGLSYVHLETTPCTSKPCAWVPKYPFSAMSQKMTDFSKSTYRTNADGSIYSAISNGNNQVHQNVEVFPNPIKKGEYLNVKSDEKILDISLFDLKGARIGDFHTISSSQYIINAIPTGVYVLQVTTAGNVEKLKLIIN